VNCTSRMLRCVNISFYDRFCEVSLSPSRKILGQHIKKATTASFRFTISHLIGNYMTDIIDITSLNTPHSNVHFFITKSKPAATMWYYSSTNVPLSQAHILAVAVEFSSHISCLQERYYTSGHRGGGIKWHYKEVSSLQYEVTRHPASFGYFLPTCRRSRDCR